MRGLIAIALLWLVWPGSAQGQTALTLQECYRRAEVNYPLIRQRDLIGQTRAYSVENASRGRFPQVILGGQATYQSEVTQIPVDMPGVEPLSKDQYRVFAEVSQTLYDGGLVSGRVRREQATADAEEEKLKADLYQIRERINDVYFGILLLREQIAHTQLMRQVFHADLANAEAAVANGVALRSSADILSAEILRLDQRIIGMESMSSAYREVLGLFIDQKIDEGTTFGIPVFSAPSDDIYRPELDMFAARKKILDAEESLLPAASRPKVDLFVQGGYGRPGLNMLENEFSFYYLGGIRFSWAISGYSTLSRQRQILDLRRQGVDVEKETFLFNTALSLSQYGAEITRLRQLIEVDDRIISLRSRIRSTAEIQHEQGVITTADLVREVNAEDQAKQDRILHETQLLLAQAKHHFTSGQQ